MNLPDGLLGSSWTLLSWLLFVPFVLHAVRQAPWRVLNDSARLNVWLGMIVVLILMWNLKAGVKPGLSLHLLGAMVFTLCFGWALAFVGLCLVLAGATLNGAAGWEALAINALLMAGVGVAASHVLSRVVARVLPLHLFIYIFANGFFGSALSVIAVGAASCLLFALDGAYSPEYLSEEYFPYFMLLGFSEAWLSGMAVTLFVVYRPEWVATFDSKQFFKNK